MRAVLIVSLASNLVAPGVSAAEPNKLVGTVVMSCVTAVKGAIVDRDVFKIDFTNKMVNNQPVRLVVDDVSINWSALPETSWSRGDTFDYSINRFNGKLSKGRNFVPIPMSVSSCQITQTRKF